MQFPILSAAEVECLRDGYCNFCGVDTAALLPTNDQKAICLVCGEKFGFCEICGSIRRDDQTTNEQLHYEEGCFK